MVRRRFQRREIVEALLFPSQVVSDQYRSVVLETKSGLAHAGMPLEQPDKSKVVLLLPDATKLEIPMDEVDRMAPSKASVMPEGVLKELSAEEVRDLFAFLETSKQNELPATGGGR